MNQTRRRMEGARPGAHRGFTLAEVMVAIAIFAIITAIAMTLYQQLQKNFKQGENAAAQQQNTRVAFDRLISDLRMAGFNYNPDGNVGRPDEQIEGMWQNAITVRGDFDHETADANSPEPTLAGATFGVVSTGNDEIVTYALGKPSGAGGTSIQFQADVTAVPRDGTVDTVTVNNIYLDMNSPPYTLYRITLKPGGTALSNMPDKQPLADNIRSLTFTYYDGVGNVITTMTGGMDTAADIAARKKIAKIGINIVGMTQDPDLAYFDPADTNPLSRNYRKFELSSDVTPRNLGYVGIPDLDLDDPNTPTGLSVCAGHCAGLVATWNANNPAEGVVKYEVTYGATQTSQASPQDVYGTSVYLSGLSTSGSYVVGVGAVDSGGNTSDPRAYSAATPMSNPTTPTAPSSFAGTSIGAGNALANKIDVSWAKPTINAAGSGMVCDGGVNNTPLRDLSGYRVARGATAGFDPNVPAQVQKSWDPNTLAGADPDPNVTDTSVVNCRTYFYKATAEDLCGKPSTVTSAVSASASTNVLPKAPLNVVATDMGQSQSLIQWNPVTQDTSATPAAVLIDSYKVYRTTIPTGNDPNTAAYTLVFNGAVASISSPSYTDPNVPNIPGTQSYYYRVSARDDCPNESAQSLPALLTKCNFGGTVQMSISPGGSPVSGTQTITVTVTAGVTPAGGQLTIRDTSGGAVVLSQSSAVYPYVFTWNAGASPTIIGHSYDVTAAVTNSSGCTDTSTQTVSVIGFAACCITAATPRVSNNTALGSVGGGTKNNEISFDIANGCGTNVTIEGLKINWNDRFGTSPQLTAWTYTGFPNVILSPPVNPESGSSPKADFDLRISPFTPYPLNTTATSLSPINVGYVFTKAMAGKIGSTPVGNVIQTEYFFRQASNGATGQCTVTIIADTSTPGITLCDPQVDPNCPGF